MLHALRDWNLCENMFFLRLLGILPWGSKVRGALDLDGDSGVCSGAQLPSDALKPALRGQLETQTIEPTYVYIYKIQHIIHIICKIYTSILEFV